MYSNLPPSAPNRKNCNFDDPSFVRKLESEFEEHATERGAEAGRLEHAVEEVFEDQREEEGSGGSGSRKR
eukprot:CAMPEP_0172318148 /NCGR_PEP_ID=MMETSP1058-20130122/33970_1 /TAXON_ID=83371 /ORGANISM="Detonula confervacea, Strain CCMP 353" /LENGTH=69 /DNA_ID=CAMNT_0013032897 /DNA_START=519 /DNA_END=728 /DNA_ORIENTATION=+